MKNLTVHDVYGKMMRIGSDTGEPHKLVFFNRITKKPVSLEVVSFLCDEGAEVTIIDEEGWVLKCSFNSGKPQTIQ